ncbi:MAG: hypothetical protein JO147_04080 [Actinobacteria bacterium]|nr:hypothetical protein [Actinomycetota bacterium]
MSIYATSLYDGEIAYRRDRVAEEFRRAGGRERGAGRRTHDRRWRLGRDVRATH